MGTNLALSSGSEDSGSCLGIDDGARKTKSAHAGEVVSS